MESDLVCNHTSDYKIAGVRFVKHELQIDIEGHEVHLPINHKDYNYFLEAQEITTLLKEI